MRIKIERSALNDWLVYCGVSLYIVVSILTTTFFSKYIPGSFVHLISILSIFLISLHNIIVRKKDLSVFGATFTLGIMSLLIYFSIGSFQNYIYSLIIIFLLKDFEFDKLVKFVLPVIISVFVFIILSSKLGVVKDYIEISATRIRHYLGFRYSLFPSTVMLNIVALYVYSKKEKITYKNLLVLTLAILWIFWQTNSRLTALSSMVLILLAILLKRYPKLLTRIRYLLIFLIPSYIFAAVASYIVAGKYTSAGSGLRAVDNFFGGRIYLASKSLYYYGFSWLGKNIQWVGNGLNADGQRSTMSYLYVDNMYIQVLQKYGLLYLIIFVTLLTITLFILYRKKQYFLFLILSILAVHAMIDDLTFYLYYNFFLVLLSLPFAVNPKKIEKDGINQL
ncbi:TPA: polymerase [Streptococcus suis]|nr:polymerase [Streptococcus suis]